MRAALIHGAGDVRVADVSDPALVEPTDAVVRVVVTCVCGSDLHPYHSKPDAEEGDQIGHEFVGIVEELGDQVAGVSVGDMVIAPFAYADDACDYCREGLQTSCPNGGFHSGAQAEKIRVPQASGSLVAVPGDVDQALLPSLLTLTDVYPTGWHAAVQAGVGPGSTVTVIGDGAVGLLAVLSAKQLGATTIILMGRHTARTDLGREFGATHVVASRGEEGIAEVRAITDGEGTHAVLEAVGHMPAYEQALGAVRPGGVISRVGVPQYEEAPVGFGSLFRHNITLTGGPAPVRAYIEQLLPAVLDGTVEPGRVFDRVIGLSEVPEGYRAMDDRESLKVMVDPTR
ncbi:zinc-binding dehydrogenase [Nesterenkonia halobia]|uniref:Zinc-dependent alcohol dehydrogenase family protein n=1 Tax=Nesterenkonia halobia TaxID=37922 RepID=A0ABP6RD77_9MICC